MQRVYHIELLVAGANDHIAIQHEFIGFEVGNQILPQTKKSLKSNPEA